MPRDPLTSDIQYPIQKKWLNTVTGAFWELQNFLSFNGITTAHWVLIGNHSAVTETLTGNDGIAVPPTANNINVLGDVTNITTTGNAGTSTLTIHLNGNVATSYVEDIGTAIPSGGILNVLGANGVTTTGAGNTITIELTGGGEAIDSIAVDAHTAPGTNPVLPDITGLITVTGAQVPAGTTTNVIRTDSLAANTYTIEVQRSQAVGSSTVGDNGVSHFDSKSFGVDANGFVTAAIPTGIVNLGVTYSASTFSITAADGSALSATNPAYIWMNSKAVPGTVIRIPITANQSFIDDTGASTISGNLFGFTATDTTASNDVPFFIYAVLNNAENAISFMISRTPGMETSPIAANIGKTGSSVADVSFAFFALSNPTVTDYVSNSCMAVGSLRMRLTTAPGDWTVQALSFTDGIGRFQIGTTFQLPTGVLGASAGTHWQPNGGTAPTFNSPQYYYVIDPSGIIQANYGATTISGNGVGAVQARLIVPLPNSLATTNDYVGGGRYESVAPSFQIVLMCFSTSDYTEIAYSDATNGNSGVLTNANLGAGNSVSSFRTQMIYDPKIS